MAFFLVRHGKYLPETEDPEKGISEEGRKEVMLIAQVAKNYGIQVGDILHSGKKRAIQTAEIWSSVIENTGRLMVHPGLEPPADVKSFEKNLEFLRNALIVGHLSFLNKLLSYLITGSEDFQIFKFQNGGIICLDQESPESSRHIRWALMPAIL